jgi:hypothetical protein
VRQEPVPWKTADLIQNAFTLPLTRLSFPRALSLQQPRASHHDYDTNRQS